MQATTEPRSRIELYKAFRALFDPERASEKALSELTADAVQASYRKRAFEVHPDRAAALGLSPTLATDRLRRVTEARGLLLAHLAATAPAAPMVFVSAPPLADEPRPFTPTPFTSMPLGATAELEDVALGEASSGTPEGPRRLHVGAVPTRRLLLGQFLYYSGKVSWRELVEAVLWQRALRPRLGELLVRLGMLSAEQVDELLVARGKRSTLGARAVQEGLLDDRQLRRVVSLQQRLQRPLGGYFVEAGILRNAELRSLVRHQQQHNGA